MNQLWVHPKILKGLTLQNKIKVTYIVEDKETFPILIEKLIRLLQKQEIKRLNFHVRQNKNTKRI